MNFAETAFVVPATDSDASFALRGFTPTTEVPYSGHQILGASYVLAQAGRLTLGDDADVEARVQMDVEVYPVTLTRRAGEIVSVSTLGRMPEFLERLDDYGALSAALSIDPIEVLQTGLPVQCVRTALTTLIVPVRSLSTVREIMPVVQAADELLHDVGAVALLVFSIETLSPQNDVHVRVFAPPLGIEEDPATGTSNAALAAYLVRHGAVAAEPQVRLRSEQGSEMGRPSIIEMRVETGSDPLRVHVGGRVARSAEGTVFY
jgi:trans-2,3-dihydro-3-hydroxyanthranilate isomerase